jgi:hypothetical protein
MRIRRKGFCQIAVTRTGYFLPQRASAALFAILFRALGESAFARAFPPLSPPRRPRLTAAGSLPCSSGVGARSSVSPVAMSAMNFASWLTSRGRFLRLGIAVLLGATKLGHARIVEVDEHRAVLFREATGGLERL